MLETIAVMIVVGVSTLSGLVVGYVMGSSDSRRKRPELDDKRYALLDGAVVRLREVYPGDYKLFRLTNLSHPLHWDEIVPSPPSSPPTPGPTSKPSQSPGARTGNSTPASSATPGTTESSRSTRSTPPELQETYQDYLQRR